MTYWWRNFFIILIVTLCKGGGIQAVKIRELRVPAFVELNDNNINEDILLDCDFDYEESEGQHLDVKWYFNGEETFFYQWLSGHKPQLIDSEFGRMFRNHLDLEHVVSGSDDPLKKHRALLLKKPTVALSGVYECKVSTLYSEDRQHKEMKIYSPAKEVIFRQEPLPNGDQVNISCTATGIFPQPQIKLLRGSYQLDDSEASVTTSSSGEGDENTTIDTFDIVVHRVVNHSEIPNKTIFGCELTIPGTEYKAERKSEYQHRGGRYHAAYESSFATSLRLSNGFFKAIIAATVLLCIKLRNSL